MQSARILTAGLIDYAGLFPPAQLEMGEAVSNYADYLTRPEAEKLGRFVLPVARLSEFENAAAQYLPREERYTPWKLAVLLSQEPEEEIARILKFNCAHWESLSGRAVIDVVEIKSATAQSIERLSAALPDFYRAFIEVPLSEGMETLLDAARAANYSAKIRTGGTERGAFPSSARIAAFMEGCQDRDLAFKATAGLHHIVCGTYPLTYGPGAEAAPMFGFLNIFAAAVFLTAGASHTEILAIIEETDAQAFIFTPEGITWRSLTVTNSQIEKARDTFAISFGSCSFTEPVEALARLADRPI